MKKNVRIAVGCWALRRDGWYSQLLRLPFGRQVFCCWILFWVAVKELKLSYHSPETILFAVYPYYGNLN